MAQEKQGKDGFQRILTPYRANDARRDIPHVVVERTGRAVTSTTATEWLLPQVSASGELTEQFCVVFDANPKTKLVVISVAPPEEPGAVTAKLSKDRRRISFHMGGVFQTYPSLGATYTRKCPFRQEADGRLVIALGAGLAHRKDPETEEEKQEKAERRMERKAQRKAKHDASPGTQSSQ